MESDSKATKALGSWWGDGKGLPAPTSAGLCDFVTLTRSRSLCTCANCRKWRYRTPEGNSKAREQERCELTLTVTSLTDLLERQFTLKIDAEWRFYRQ